MKTVKPTLSKTARLSEQLRAGKTFTAAQIKHRFGLANPRASVSDVRRGGLKVYAVQRSGRATVYSTKATV
jgi:hypothetical protein